MSVSFQTRLAYTNFVTRYSLEFFWLICEELLLRSSSSWNPMLAVPEPKGSSILQGTTCCRLRKKTHRLTVPVCLRMHFNVFCTSPVPRGNMRPGYKAFALEGRRGEEWVLNLFHGNLRSGPFFFFSSFSLPSADSCPEKSA